MQIRQKPPNTLLRAGKIPVYAALLCAILAFSAHASGINSVGFREIRGDDVVFGLWYPADAASQTARFGRFAAEYAEDAPPVGDALPLVLLSHGSGGRYRNHHLTASYLAQNGFVVAAPQHAKIKRKFSDIPGRVGDIKNAVAALRLHPDFAEKLNFENINAVGYSRGGAAALAAAGADINISAFLLHCAKHYAEDENACGGLPLWTRLFLRFQSAYLKKREPEILDFSQNPAPFQKIALVAPVGQCMDAASLKTLRAQTLILQIENDNELRAPYHAEYLRANLPPGKTRFTAVKNGHHFLFVALPALTEAEKATLPAKFDPPGFDRKKFIADINEKILSFLQN